LKLCEFLTVQYGRTLSAAKINVARANNVEYGAVAPGPLGAATVQNTFHFCGDLFSIVIKFDAIADLRTPDMTLCSFKRHLKAHLCQQ